jgi:RNA polymerase primary sigma factor
MTHHEPDATLVIANLPFVTSVASRYRNRGLPLEDLICEGRVGLVEAARRYDPSRGARFTTYSVYWIKRAILRALATQRTMVHLPNDRQRVIRTLRDVERLLTLEHGRAPRAEEIALRLGLPLREVELMKRACRGVTSLASTVHEREEMTLQDLLPADPPWNPDHRMQHAESIARLRCALRALSARDRMVLDGRYGLDGSLPRPLRVLGERLGMTREGARLAEHRALRRLRSEIHRCRRSHRSGRHEEHPGRVQSPDVLR